MKKGNSMMKRIKKMGIVLLFLLMMIAKNSHAISPSDYGMDYDFFVNVASTQTIGGDKTFSDVITFDEPTLSTSTYSQDSELLDGHDSTYYAIKADVISSTDTLGSDLNTAELAITDLETLTATMGVSTDTLSGYITDLETLTATIGESTDTLSGYITDLETLTVTMGVSTDTISGLVTDLETLTATIGESTDTISGLVTDLETSTSTLEGYAFDLFTSTNTLESATALNTTHRGSDGSDHSFINQDVTTTGTPAFSTINVGSGNLKANAQSAVIKNSTTITLQGTTPIETGEAYWNTDTNELWVATGTLVNQFIHK